MLLHKGKAPYKDINSPSRINPYYQIRGEICLHSTFNMRNIRCFDDYWIQFILNTKDGPKAVPLMRSRWVPVACRNFGFEEAKQSFMEDLDLIWWNS
jgi:hypothetical protein